MISDPALLEKLEAISAKIRICVAPEESFRDASADICDLFNAERVTIYEVDRKRRAISAIVKTGLDGFRRLILAVDESSIAGYVALHKTLLNIRDAYDDSELASHGPPVTFLKEVDRRSGFRTREVLAAPIQDAADGSLLGVLQVINHKLGSPFPAVQEEIAMELCRALATAFTDTTKYGWLVTSGNISAGELGLAQRSARRNNFGIEAILVEQFQINAAAIGAALSSYFGVPYEGFSQNRTVSRHLLEKVSREVCEAHKFIPIEETLGDLTVLALDPGRTRRGWWTADKIFPGKSIIYKVTTEAEFAAALDQVFGVEDFTDLLNLVPSKTENTSGVAGLPGTKRKSGQQHAGRGSGAAAPWKTVRIFISSTFRDMHAERDHLVRVVFPELRERCAKRRLHLVEVDLRWGVTEEEAEQGKALAICLDEIERCRPYFVGILGERYGWVPSRYELPDEPRYDRLRQLNPVYSITALEIHDGVLGNPAMGMRAFFYFRHPEFISNIPVEHRTAFLHESEEAASKLKQLKADIRGRYPVYDYRCRYDGVAEDGKVRLSELETFGQKMLEDLWSAISSEHTDEGAPHDDLAVERAYHEAFIEGRSRRFIGRGEHLQALAKYSDGDEDAPLIVVGTPGSGKSALLANFARDYARAHPETLVLTHFIGVSPGSTNIRHMLLRLCRELAFHIGIEDEIPEDYEKLRKAFPAFLRQAASGTKVVLVLDALNQLDGAHHAETMNWFPSILPAGLRVIASTLEGKCLDVLRQRRATPTEVGLGPLTENDRKEIVRQVLWDYRKRLDERPGNDQMGRLLAKRESNSPLYLVVACDELRVFGDFEGVIQRITALPDEVPALFEQVLARLERDHGEELAGNALALIASSRNGLLETEILDLLKRPEEQRLPEAVWARLYRSLAPFIRPGGETGEGALDFFHQQLVVAVRERYLAGERERLACHEQLAGYFRRKSDPAGDRTWRGNYPRGLSELPHHQIQGHLWPELQATLCDLGFIGAKSAAGMTYELMADYDAALDCGDLPYVTRNCATEFARFVVAKGHLIAKRPAMAFQEAANEPQSSVVAQEAIQRWNARQETEPWIRWLNKPESPSLPLTTFSGHNERITAVEFSPDGAQLVSSSENSTRFWDASTGEELSVNEDHANVYQIEYSPDGTRILSCSGDRSRSLGGKLTLWDRTTGEKVAALGTHEFGAHSCHFSPDGKQVFSFLGGAIRYWDAATGEQLGSVQEHGFPSTSKALAASSGRVVLSDSYQRLKLWESANGRTLTILPGHTQRVTSLSFSADGNRLLSGSVYFPPSGVRGVAESGHDELKMWDVGNGLELATIAGQRAGTFSPDGRQVISASHDGTIGVWSADTQKRLGALGKANENYKSLAVSPDANRAAFESPDHQIRLWDMASRREVVAGPQEAVTRCAFSPDGTRVVSSAATTDPSLLLLDTVTGKVLYRYSDVAAEVQPAFCFSSDGKRLAFQAKQDEIRVLDALNGGELVAFPGELMHRHAFSPNGGRIASVSRENESVVQLRDMQDGQKVVSFACHAGSVTACVFSPDGRRIAACAYNTIELWDSADGRQLAAFSGHSGHVVQMAFTPDGTRLISASIPSQRTLLPDGAVKLWDVSTGSELSTSSFIELSTWDTPFQGQQESAFALSPDGGQIAFICLEKVLTLGDRMTGGVIATLSQENELAADREAIRTVIAAFSPDGRRVIASRDIGTLKLYDSITGAELATMSGHSGPVANCLFSPDGRRIVTAGHDGKVILWNAANAHELASLEGYAGPLQSLDHTPDGKRFLILSDGQVGVHEMESGRKLVALSGHGGPIHAVMCSPAGDRILTLAKSEIKIWNVATWDEMASLSGDINAGLPCKFAPDGKRVIFCSNSRDLKLWEGAGSSRQEAPVDAGASVNACASFSPDGTMTVAAVGFELKVWAGKTGETPGVLGKHHIVWNCAFSPDGKRIVTASEDGTLKIWDASERRELTTITGHKGHVWGCAFSPDGGRIASTSSDETLRFWDGTTGRALQTLALESWGRSCIFSPDGRRILYDSGQALLKLCDADTGRQLARFPANIHRGWANAYAFSPDGSRIVSGSYDGPVSVWDAASGEKLLAIDGHTELATVCSFSPEGALIVSASSDRTIKLWDASSGKLICEYHLNAPARAVAWGRDGLGLSLLTARGEVIRLKLENFQSQQRGLTH